MMEMFWLVDRDWPTEYKCIRKIETINKIITPRQPDSRFVRVDPCWGSDEINPGYAIIELRSMHPSDFVVNRRREVNVYRDIRFDPMNLPDRISYREKSGSLGDYGIFSIGFIFKEYEDADYVVGGGSIFDMPCG
ncbi:MAG: hypothetical protein HXY25_04645 [Alphaproteobacteria bacterium]|nr:hypothetical protein [Alphaproteobacteria bacterium]